MKLKYVLMAVISALNIQIAHSQTDTLDPVNNMPNAFTADSKRIIFQSWSKLENGKSINQLLSMNLDGSDVRREVGAGFNMGWPEFTRDGKRVALFSQIEKNYDLLVFDLMEANNLAQFSSVKRITHHPKEDFFISWSPDEKQLAFYSHRDEVNPSEGEKAQIYVVNVDGTAIKNLSNNNARESDPDWSIQNQITFQSNLTGNNDIWVMNGNGHHRSNLTNHPAEDHFGDWSPDGEHIMFSSDRDGDEDLYIMDKNGANVRQLTNAAGIDRWPLWSPDGKTITFSRVVNKWGYVYTITPDGRQETKLTEKRSYQIK